MISRLSVLLLGVGSGLAWFAALGFLFTEIAPARVTTVCVKPGGGNGCDSSISSAVTGAQPGDIIRVATGVYTENLLITQTVTLDGGWDAAFTSRDPAVHVSILRPANPDVAIVTILGQFGNTAATTPTVDGFTITGARSTNHGGGLRITNSDAIVRSNVITDNLAYFLGGGIWVQNGAPRIEHNRIENNRVTPSGNAYGGGIELENTQATLIGNIIAGNFISNSTGYGGGVEISGGGPVILDGNTIMSNTAANQAGAAADYGYGGGIAVQFASVTLSNNLIRGNTANLAGANARGFGGGLVILNSVLNMQGGQVVDNLVSANCEGDGGGLYASGSSITLDALRVESNCAANTPANGLGGGMSFINSPYTLTNAILASNGAAGNDSVAGGLVADANSPGILANNTLANNNGQGIRSASPLMLTNNIVMGHTTGISLTATVPVSATCNDFFSNTIDQRGFTLDATNLAVDPLLDSNYHLTGGSSLMDAGGRANAPAHDIDGEPRPMQGTSELFRFDIGADEYTGSAQVNRDLRTQPADFTLIGPGNPQDHPASTGSNDWIGFALMGGDINGDQRADLVVGAPNLSGDFDGGVNDDGRVFALDAIGARRLGVLDLYTVTADLEVRSWLHQQHIGRAFAASDLNGDGKKDLIIGSIGGDANGQPVTGTVYVFAGGSGLTGTRTLSPAMQATFRFVSPESTQSFGEANSLAAGPLNGSAPDDLVVGESNANGPGNRTQAGAVRVFFGSANLPAVWDTRVLSASLTIYGATANAHLGRVALADTNGDGKLDLIARSVSTLYVFYGPLAVGVVDLAAGGADLSIGGFGDGPLAVGDVNGDHHADVVLGDGNNIKVVRGNTTSVMATFTNVTPSALHLFDWNGDGRADIFIGESFQNRVLVVWGSSVLSGTADIIERASWIIGGEKPADQFGYSLDSADLDGDGLPDLILGSRAHTLDNRPDPHFNDAGAVYVLYGAGRRNYLPLMLR